MKCILRHIAVCVFVCLVALVAVPACAQYTAVSASLVGGTRSYAVNGTIYWQPATGVPGTIAAAVIGGNGGQVLALPLTASVSQGAFALSVPDALLADPKICYAVTIVNLIDGRVLLGAGLSADGSHVALGGPYGCVQPTGSNWSFDAYIPALSSAAVQRMIPAPSTVTPLMDGAAVVGVSTQYARADHVHPTDTSRAAASDLATEVTRAEAAEAADASAASAAQASANTANTAVATEATRAEAAEAADASAASAAQASANTANTAVATEATRAEAAEAADASAASAAQASANTANTAVATEATRAEAAEAADASAASAAQASANTANTAVATEATRAEAAEAADASAASAAQASANTANTAVATEATRAEAAEAADASAASAAQSTANKAVTAAATAQSAVSTEATRAEAAESANATAASAAQSTANTALSTETVRAESAESANATAAAAAQTTANSAVTAAATAQSAASAEATRAEAAEAVDASATAAAQTTANTAVTAAATAQSAVTAETTRAEAAEATDASAASASAAAAQAAAIAASDPAGSASVAQSASVATAEAYSSNASNLSSGTVPPARMPAPTASTLGGVQALAATAHQYVTGVSTGGVVATEQPSSADLSDLGQAGGAALLTSGGILSTSEIPPITIDDVYTVASQAAMLLLDADQGDICVRTDLSESFILSQTPATTLANWVELLAPPASVLSVNGQTGAVALAFYNINGSLLHSQLPALVAADIPDNAANTTGNAATASALASTPAQCSSGQYATGVTAAGTANCAQVAVAQVSGTAGVSQIGSGAAAAGKYVDGGTGEWTALPAVPVSSVFGRTGAVVAASGDYTAAMVGLGNVANAAQTLASVMPNTAPSSGQFSVGNADGTAYIPTTMSGDCTLASGGAIACTKSSGTAFGSAAFTSSTAYDAAGAAAARQPIITATGILKGTGSGGISSAVAGTDYQAPLTNPVTSEAAGANGGDMAVCANPSCTSIDDGGAIPTLSSLGGEPAGGSSDITTVGTITQGIWEGSQIDVSQYLTYDYMTINGYTCALGQSCALIPNTNYLASVVQNTTTTPKSAMSLGYVPAGAPAAFECSMIWQSGSVAYFPQFYLDLSSALSLASFSGEFGGGSNLTPSTPGTTTAAGLTLIGIPSALEAANTNYVAKLHIFLVASGSMGVRASIFFASNGGTISIEPGSYCYATMGSSS
ncbi:hypothetical protein ACOBR2_06725 [Telmatobacter bradus]|uniref:hypothetical protein n=1 Tax=Telmatobacter bradus TaxID=474953 RepID=UPI003B428485